MAKVPLRNGGGGHLKRELIPHNALEGWGEGEQNPLTVQSEHEESQNFEKQGGIRRQVKVCGSEQGVAPGGA